MDFSMAKLWVITRWSPEIWGFSVDGTGLWIISDLDSSSCLIKIALPPGCFASGFAKNRGDQAIFCSAKTDLIFPVVFLNP